MKKVIRQKRRGKRNDERGVRRQRYEMRVEKKEARRKRIERKYWRHINLEKSEIKVKRQ